MNATFGYWYLLPRVGGLQAAIREQLIADYEMLSGDDWDAPIMKIRFDPKRLPA